MRPGVPKDRRRGRGGGLGAEAQRATSMNSETVRPLPSGKQNQTFSQIRTYAEVQLRLSRWLQMMLYTSLGSVGLSGGFEAVHLLRCVAGHDLDCGPLVHDAEVSRFDEDLDGLGGIGQAEVDALTTDGDVPAR